MRRQIQDTERPNRDDRKFNSESNIEFLKAGPDIEQHETRCPGQGQK